MTFQLVWTKTADETRARLQRAAESASEARRRRGEAKSSRQEGLFKQVMKTVGLPAAIPRHPSLRTHEYSSIPHPYDPGGKVFEAYAQARTPGA